jgi:hypothetical protein
VAVLLLVLIWMPYLAPMLCFADSVTKGTDPFTPSDSYSGSRVSLLQNTSASAKSSVNSMQLINSPTESVIPNYNGFGPLKPVSPALIVSRILALAGDADSAIAALIIPLAIFGMVLSCGVLVFGWIFDGRMARSFGWGGLVASIVSLLVFFNIPTILSLIRWASNRLTF